MLYTQLQEAINAERAKNAAAKLRKVQGRDWDASKLDAEAPAIRPSELPRPASPSPPSSPTPASRYADTEVWDSVEHRSDEEVAREKERKRKGEEAAKAAAEAAREARETAQREEREREERRRVREASEPTMVKGRGEKLGGSKGMRSMWDS